MKRLYLFLVGALALITWNASAADTLLADFEDGNTVTFALESNTSNMTLDGIVNNPASGTKNSTDKVYKISTASNYGGNSSNPWNTGFNMKFAQNIPDNSYLHLAIYTNMDKIEFNTAKSVNGDGSTMDGKSLRKPKQDEWIDVVVQMNTVNAGSAFRIEIDSRTSPNGPNNSKYLYIDEIVINNNASPRSIIPSPPPVPFPTGMKLYITPHGDSGNYFRVLFSGSTTGASDSQIHLGPIGSPAGFFEITVPPGNYEYVNFGRNDSGNGTPWNWTGISTYNPSYNWIKITNYFNPGNFTWHWYSPPAPPTRLEDFNFFPIISNWENPGISATVSNYNEGYTNPIASSSKVINPAKIMNKTDSVYQITTNSVACEWWTGALVQFEKPIAVSATNKYIHIALKTAAPNIEFAFIKDNTNNNPAYAGIGSISSNNNEWKDYVYNLQGNIDGKGWGNNWNCTGFRIVCHTDGSGGAVNREKTIYIDEIIVNDDPNPRTTISAYGEWTGAADNNWNNRNNWINGVPSFITSNVIIPGGLSNYPILNESAPYDLEGIETYNDCNSIVFEAGAKLGNQHLLTYTEATVKYGLASNRWHTISTSITPAKVQHFYRDRSPSTWVQRFGPAYGAEEQWNFIADLNHSFAIGDGFAFFYNPTPVLSEPFFLTGKLEEATEVTKTLNWGHDSDENTDFALLGNPFMTTIGFDKLYETNASKINDSYLVYTAAGYVGYNLTTGAYGIVDDIDQFIAPLQGFIVEKAGAGSLIFDVEAGIQATGAPASLRSSVVKEDLLSIVASNPTASVRTILAQRETGNHSRKLFDDLSKTPDVYTKNGNKSFGVQLLQSNNVLIPLGLRTNYTGEMSFTFSGMDSYNAQITFSDVLTGANIDLTDLATYTYEMNYTPVSDNEDGRFFILFAPKTPNNIVTISDGIVGQRYYNLQGVEIARPVEQGVYLVKNLFESGRTSVVKVIR